MKRYKEDISSLFLVRIAAFCVFFGRALQHFIYDTPYRVLLWDEESTGISMDDGTFWSNLFYNEIFIDTLSTLIGIYFIIVSIICLTIKKPSIEKEPKFIRWRTKKALILGGTLLLFFLSFLYYKDKFYQLAQFLEYSLQIASPLLLLMFLEHKIDLSKQLLIMGILIAFTFGGHAIYALGCLPIPIQFVEMTMNILNLDETNAKLFLIIAGIMDLVIAIGIFTQWKHSKYAIRYAIMWGGITALARIVYTIDIEAGLRGIFQGFTESTYRACHCLIPLVYYFLKREEYTISNQ